jgi:predicted DCC family thiol-disulfide oxidoreductase YuxK
MKSLKKADNKQQIMLEDINAASFSDRFPHVNKDKAMMILHGQTQDGKLIYGLDVTYQAWKTVGKHRWLIILRLPVIKFFADKGYLFFAKYRQPISRFLMPNTVCTNKQCGIYKDRK